MRLQNKFILLLSVWLLLFSQTSMAQSNVSIDSLHQQLASAKQDTSKVILLNEISQYYYNTTIDSSKFYAEQALALAEEKGFIFGQALSKKSLINILWENGEHKKALLFFEQALELFEQTNDLAPVATLLKTWVSAFLQIGEYEKAITYGEKYLKVAQQLKDTEHEGGALYQLGFLYARVLGDNEKGMEAYKKAEKLLEKLEISATYVKLLSGIAQLYITQGKYELGLTYAFKALDTQKKLGGGEALGEQYRTLGWVYMDLQDYDKSLTYFQQALDVFTTEKYAMGIGLVNEDLGGAYTKKNNYDKGLLFYKKALTIYEDIGYESGISGAIYGLGRVHKYLGNYEEALGYGKRSLELDLKIGTPETVLYSYFGLGELYFAMGKFKEAYQHTKQSFDMSKQLNFIEYTKQTSELLVKITRKQGRYKEALTFQDEYLAAKDSLFNQKNILDLAEQEADFRHEKEALKDSIANAEKEKVMMAQLNAEKAVSAQKEQQLYFSLGGAVILLLAAGYSYNRYRFINDQKIIIEEQKHHVDRKNEENELLLKEIHHRVKNNLQIVSSLLNLQTQGAEDETTLAAMTEGQNRIQAMALIHQGLYQNTEMATIKFQEYTEQLLAQLVGIYSDGKQIQKEVDAGDIELDIDTAIPLGLILNELITNSFKYAFTDMMEGSLKIELSQKAEDEYLLTVQDSGKGLPNDFNLKKAKSIGLKLVKGLSRQLHGKFDYKFESGAKFTISFKSTTLRKQIA